MRDKLLAAMQHLYSGRPDADSKNPVWSYGSEREALLYALLYIPEFIEVEGSILQIAFRVDSKAFPESFIDAKKSNKRPLHELEDSFNRIDTSHVCGSVPKENHVTGEDDRLFAECIIEAWRGRLALLYPKRRFKVFLYGTPESGDDYAVTFHEIR